MQSKCQPANGEDAAGEFVEAGWICLEDAAGEFVEADSICLWRGFISSKALGLVKPKRVLLSCPFSCSLSSSTDNNSGSIVSQSLLSVQSNSKNLFITVESWCKVCGLSTSKIRSDRNDPKLKDRAITRPQTRSAAVRHWRDLERLRTRSCHERESLVSKFRS